VLKRNNFEKEEKIRAPNRKSSKTPGSRAHRQGFGKRWARVVSHPGVPRGEKKSERGLIDSRSARVLKGEAHGVRRDAQGKKKGGETKILVLMTCEARKLEARKGKGRTETE